MTKFIRLFTLLFFFSLIGFSQISKVHYIPPLTSNELAGGGSSLPQDQFIYLSTPSTDNVTVTITPLNGDSPTIIDDLSNTTPKRYDIPGSGIGTQLFVDNDQTGGSTTLNAGFLIEKKALLNSNFFISQPSLKLQLPLFFHVISFFVHLVARYKLMTLTCFFVDPFFTIESL